MAMLIWVLLGLALAALAAATVLLVWGTWYRAPSPGMHLRITQRFNHPSDWFTLILQRPWYARALPLPRFQAGQSVSVSFPGTRLRRRYSLARWSNFPFKYEITIKCEPQGKLTNRLATKAMAGTQLCVQAPSGEFVLPRCQSGSRIVLIAGGVGITPLLAMLDQCLNQQLAFREIYLYWQVRFEFEWMYREVLEQQVARDSRIRLRLLASKPAQCVSERISSALLARELGDLSDTTFLMCASQSMLDDLTEGLQTHGALRSSIHFERFGVAGSGRATGTWKLAIAGKQLAFEGHASLLDALEDGGLSLPSDCRTGTCGQCRLRVLTGQTAHLVKPEFVVPAGQVLACCSIPESDLTLCAV